MTPSLDVVLEAGDWPPLETVEGWVASSLEAANEETNFDLRCCEVTVVLTDDEAMQAINRQHRDQDKPTNVLSFPALIPEQLSELDGSRPFLLGDLVFAYETVLKEAELGKISLQNHMCHLIVHGFLHLLGYDHEYDSDAEAMETLETNILARLGIANPYRA